ncbi:MAG: flagellar basal body L-ring protein FlgH [Deltaproteobacteria bacterium]|nr:flagellar basal body L-ring protein FlgH [Deltaproteobacteria bacterium]
MQTTHVRLVSGILALWLLVGLGGCTGNRKNIQPAIQQMPPSQMIVRQPAVSVEENNGSLWQARSSFNGLFIDTKARNMGDIVTVRIEESAKATNKANTETERTSGLEAGIEKLFGIEDWWQDEILPDVNGKWPKIDPFGKPSVKGYLKSEFEGDGETSRSGNLEAFITCRVVDVMANGNLKIVGTREVMVNHENQLIILSGIIRPRDISDTNVILSTFISDAKIAYSGSGVIDDRQRPGWLANLLNNVWPF